MNQSSKVIKKQEKLLINITSYKKSDLSDPYSSVFPIRIRKYFCKPKACIFDF